MIITYSHLSDNLHCNPKLFANDTSLFSTAHNITKAATDLNND